MENRLTFEVIKQEVADSSEESSDSDSAEVVYNYFQRIPKILCKNYVEDVVCQYTDLEFKSHFRLSRLTFIFLLEILSPQLRKQSEGCGRPTISPEKTLLLAIWMMATPNSYRCVADRFDVSGRARAQKTWSFVQDKYNFPKVLGFIDGTHIKIAAPKVDPEAYINRKGYHSLQLQVICDHELKFIHVYAGQVGSEHDVRVFRLSGIDNMCTLQNFPENSHLLGNAAYGLQKCVMVPFKDDGHLTDLQKMYNVRLSQARMTIDIAIGLLKGRFRSLLDKLPMTRTDLIAKYIIACCILHNICLIKNDAMDVPIIVQDKCAPIAEVEPVIEGLRQEGVEKRNAIMYYLQNQN